MTATVPLAPVEFDVRGPLPRGVTVLEASAGTGKTYTIAGLAARYVAEGIPLDRLLLVTFTRIATGELRERVRDRLVAVQRGVAARLAGAPAQPGEDPVVELLASGDARRACERLARAVAGFDAATIATTHGFCQEVLGGLGIAGDLEPDVAFAEDLSDLIADVVDDLYVRKFHRGERPPFPRAQAGAIVRAAIENPTAALLADEGEVPQMRRGLAEAARRELERRKRAMAVMTYDDLVTRLNAALAGPGRAAVAGALRERFAVVLVDEFQDTDPAQWEILRSAFADSGVTLVLIADPKQAIYAFRGADVYSYLEAARGADTRATLPVNWRSDQPLIDAHDLLFSGVRLGHEEIAYRQVRAAPEHQNSGLRGAPEGAPLRVRVARREHPDVSLTRWGYAVAASARRHIACDAASEIAGLLSSEAEVAVAGEPGRYEPVAPRHLAVLVRTNRQAAMIREALEAAGVPAVINGAGSVFGTDAAREWLRLLEALERPASVTRAHSAALTAFLGWPAGRLARAAEDESSREWEDAHRRLHDWARVLRTRGIASLLETVMRDRGDGGTALPGRMLGVDDGERRLTDIRHVGELLHGAATAEQLGPTALTAWLRARIADAAADTADEERSRRLESDAAAVQVLTIHRSKGLEFPIVLLPYLWDMGWMSDDPEPVCFHDADAGDARVLDVGLQGPGYRAHRERFVAEQRGEDLRLAYVAITRARHQVIMWWAGSSGSRDSPLARILFFRDAAGNVAPAGRSTPADEALLTRLRDLSGDSGLISVEATGSGRPAHWSAPAPTAAELQAAPFHRSLDRRWRRTSYSDITAGGHDAWVTSEPEQPLLVDEPDAAGAPVAPAAPAAAAQSAEDPLPLSQMPAGVEVGTFVHRVMEMSDFAAPDLAAELDARIADALAGRPVEVGPRPALVAGLRAVIETPLGPVLGGRRLRDVPRSDRLDELGFELPLAGGDRPRGWLTLARLAEALTAGLPSGDPFAAYGERLRDPRLRQRVRGYLTGSLDLVVRAMTPGGPRFAVIDYKTNWLGAPGEPLTAADYRAEALTGEMLRHHYALQALLYAVALHRFLRWRLRDYDPDRHLAGVAYLFVRGMTGDSGDAPAGVFTWQPPPGLVPALSDTLDAAAEDGG